ncbi:hypothetical protein E4N62_26415 [Streptomyces sp. MNU76]|uniref:hypothetical protein n=1 Tax=Streptomyces sp. MNU76 TaxID=2560026 RepID=UPI001E53D75B|nr:hypothetical protein [Streptomyces sp. MNU76]MCC9708485.1 hypothetical protein [Streptomyces sp. MNU76]
MPPVTADGRGRRADHARRAETAKTSATRTALWTAKWLNAQRRRAQHHLGHHGRCRRQCDQVAVPRQWRRAGATTAVAGTTDVTGRGCPEIAGRSGMSLGIGAVMRSR